MIKTDYRACAMDVSLEGYFEEEMASWDDASKVVLNLVRRSY